MAVLLVAPQASLLRLAMHPPGSPHLANDFGYRYLQHDDQNWILLHLSRHNDTTWIFYLSYLKEPPSEDVVDQVLADIRGAASRLGFITQDVVRESR